MAIVSPCLLSRRRNGRRNRHKCASASCYKAIHTGGVVIRRLADMHWICNRSDKQQQRAHDGGNNGDGGNNAGFHSDQSSQKTTCNHIYGHIISHPTTLCKRVLWTPVKKPLPNHGRGLIWLSLDNTDHVVVLVIHVAKLMIEVSVYDVVVVKVKGRLQPKEVYLKVVTKALHDITKLVCGRLTSLIPRLISAKDFDRGHLWLVVIVSISIRHFKRIHNFAPSPPRKRHTQYLDLQRAATMEAIGGAWEPCGSFAPDCLYYSVYTTYSQEVFLPPSVGT